MDRYGLIGKRLGHSFSQAFFKEKFAREGIDATYANYEMDSISALPALVASTPGLRGLNVTIPYKQAVMSLLDRIDPAAAAIGAVNTIRIAPDGRLEGFNTDAPGFAEALRHVLNGHPTPQSALILGTGGASRAVDYALRAMGIAPLFVSRKPAPGMLGYDALTAALLQDYTLIVNTTPLGMWPDTDSAPDLPYEALTPAHVCFDLVYNPDPTLFMQRAAARGALTCSGALMLRLQAEASWRIWNSKSDNHKPL